jgi:hypothetical protein
VATVIVQMNEAKLCGVPIGSDDQLDIVVSAYRSGHRNSLDLRIWTYHPDAQEHSIWAMRSLSVGDRVLLLFGESDSYDSPSLRIDADDPEIGTRIAAVAPSPMATLLALSSPECTLRVVHDHETLCNAGLTVDGMLTARLSVIADNSSRRAKLRVAAVEHASKYIQLWAERPIEPGASTEILVLEGGVPDAPVRRYQYRRKRKSNAHR